MNADLHPVDCSSQDSDADGYVSCTANDLANMKLVDLECSYRNTGCKVKESVQFEVDAD